MNISKFLIKRFEIEDFYLDLHLTESSFLDACLFHDIGKSEVEKEYLFRDLCQSPYDVHKYLEHIQFGLQHIIDPDIDKYIAKYNELINRITTLFDLDLSIDINQFIRYLKDTNHVSLVKVQMK